MSNQQAFSEVVAALSRDMPILMHGSGDVNPDQVNPHTVQLLSELTARYISNLVDAAIDAQQLLAGGQETRAPPPRYPRSREPPLPSFPDSDKNVKSEKKDDDDKSSKTTKAAAAAAAAAAVVAPIILKKRSRRPDVDYWDEPMPEPNIVKKAKTEDGVVLSAGTHPASSSGSKTGRSAFEDDDEKPRPPVHHSLTSVDEWVGAAGVDLWEQSRSRAAYVRMPDAVGVQCFIFPICHDGFLYGKVMQVQASRRAIAPVLVDSVLLDLVRTEGALARKHAPRRKKITSTKKDGGDADVEDEPDQEDDELSQDDDAAWPGLEYLLPVHAITEAMVVNDGGS